MTFWLYKLLLFGHSVVSDSATPWTVGCQALLSFTISQSLLEVTFVELMMPTISASVAPFSSCPQSFPASMSFSMSDSLDQLAEYWSFSINTSKEYSGLFSFRIDWFDLLSVQGTLKRVFSNTTVQKHQFFGAQLSLWSNSHIHT